MRNDYLKFTWYIKNLTGSNKMFYDKYILDRLIDSCNKNYEELDLLHRKLQNIWLDTMLIEPSKEGDTLLLKYIEYN